MNIRVLAAVCTGLIAGLLGQRWAGSIRAEAVRLRRWTLLLERLRLLLQQGMLPLPELLAETADGSNAPDRLLQMLAARMKETPLCSLLDCYEAIAPDLPEDKVLRTLMTQLDRGSLESRVLAAEQAHAGMVQLSECADSRSARDAAMWSRLGWTGGACLTILLI